MFDALLKSNQTVTVNGNGTAIKVDFSPDVDIQLIVKNVTGTAPTLDVTFEVSVDGTTYVPVFKLPQITGAKTVDGISVDMTKYKFIRPVFAVTGTSPSFDVEVKLN